MLLTGQTAALAPDLDGVLYEPRGRQQLRNVREPVELFAAVRPGEASDSHLAVDPVCRMAVDPDHAAGRLMFEGTAYFFCTLACAGAFAARPERYVPAAGCGAAAAARTIARCTPPDGREGSVRLRALRAAERLPLRRG